MLVKNILFIIGIICMLTFVNAYSSNNFPGYICYQESADTVNQTGVDGNCGLIYSGSYNDYGGFNNIYVNYTKPINSLNSSIWQVNHGINGTYNISIPSDCWNYNINTLAFRFYSTQGATTGISNPYCFNGTWKQIGNYYSGTKGTGGFGSGISLMNDGIWNTGIASFSGIMWVISNGDYASINEEAMIWNISSLSSENLTFTGSNNFTRYLKIPQNTILTNAYINKSGFNISDCYQETANKSNINDGTCGVFYNGTYAIDVGYSGGSDNKTLIYDGDWNTFADNHNFQINYTKPINSNYAVWKTKDADAVIYYSVVNQSCFNYNPNKIVLRMFNSGGGINRFADSDCFNGTDWVNMVHISVGEGRNEIFEEAIIWGLSSYPRTNLANSINTYLSTCSYLNGFCNVPFTFNSQSAGILNYQDLLFNNEGILENSQTFNSTTYETYLENFMINITYDTNYYTSINATLNYNGTLYNGNYQFISNNLIINSQITMPKINSNSQSNYFFWNISYTNSSGTFYYKSNNYTQTINKIIFRLCNSTFNNSFVNFTIRNAEYPYSIINASFKANFLIGSGSSLLNYTYQDTSQSNSSFSFCFYPLNSNYTTNAIIEYEANNYAKNYYYLVNAGLTNATTNINLYLLNDSKATLTELWSRDSAQKGIENVYFYIQYYDLGTDSYYTVAMGKSNYLGKDIVYLNWYDSLYRFILIKDGIIIKQTTPTKISSTPQTFDIIGSQDFTYDKFNSLLYTLTYNNLTNNFVLTFTDPTGLVKSGCLKVIKNDAIKNIIICDNCQSSSSATLYCNIGSYGNGTYSASFYGLGSFAVVDTIIRIIGNQNNLYIKIGKIDGSIYAFLLSGIILAVMMVSPVFGIIAALLGLIASISFGFLPLDSIGLPVYIGIIIIGGVIIWILKR